MGNVNIFESIRKVTSRIEPFHSQFLADALTDSLNGNRALFDKFWRLAAPDGWEVPERAEIEAEEDLGNERGRIDICIRSTCPARILGVEVKTTDSSATEGQLGRYLDGLKCKYSEHTTAVAYLTPFNSKRAGDLANQLPTVEEYKRFSRDLPESRHVSWLDVAEIAWDYGNELWQQHRSFVLSEISSYQKLKDRTERDRSFNVFFGDAAADAFWERLKVLGIESSPGAGARVPLSRIDDLSAFVDAFEILINRGEGVPKGRNQSKKADRFSNREAFMESRFGNVHEALFQLSCRFECVWIQGEKNYGVRVAHSSHPSSGVSLVRSLDYEHLLVGEPR